MKVRPKKRPWRTHEDSSDSDVNVILIFVSVHHRLRDALSLVVASPNSNCIHIPPIRLGLGMNLRVSVDFASAGQQDTSLHPLRQPLPTRKGELQCRVVRSIQWAMTEGYIALRKPVFDGFIAISVKRTSMFMVPIVLVFIVLTGLYW